MDDFRRLPGRGHVGGVSVRTRHLEIRRRARYAARGPEDGTARELWFVLHGYSQLAPRFLEHFDALDDGSRLLVAPEGLHRHYLDPEETRVGASWMTSEDRLTDIEDYVAFLDLLHAHVAHDVAPMGEIGRPRTVALGFSQGVHTLCRWIAFGEARLDRAVLWGATTPPDLDLERHGDALRAVDLHLVVGEDDRYFDPAAVRAHEARLRSSGIAFTAHAFRGGHRLDDDILRGLASTRVSRRHE